MVLSPWGWQPPTPMRLEQAVGLLRLEGPDSLRVLHGQTSQALALARPGQWLGTCLITPTGRMRAVAEVLVESNAAWLVITSGDPAAVRLALDRVLFPADDVRLGPLQQGRLLTPLGTPLDPEDDGPAPCLRGEHGQWQPLAEGGWLLGEQVLVPEGTPAPAWLERRPALGEQAAARWRIQQGIPAAPHELNDSTNPFELGLASRVSLSKGCYVGQETLAKLATYDGVKQQLRRWFCPSSPGLEGLLAPGAPLETAIGERAGVVTSVVELDPLAGGGWIGLALVRRQALAADTLQRGSAPLTVSIPEEFVPPPVGPGGQGSGGQEP